MKRILRLCVALLCLHPLGLSAEDAKMPDFSKTFPTEKLFNQMKMEKVETYAYSTDLEFDEVKARFWKFVGKGWKEQKTEPALRKLTEDAMKANGVSGYLMVHNPAFPGVAVTVTRTEMEMEGKSFLVNITVIRNDETDAPDGD